MGKMSYESVIANFNSKIRSKSTLITASIVTLCFVLILVFVLFSFIDSVGSLFNFIALLILRSANIAMLIVLLLVLIYGIKDYNQDQDLFKQIKKKPSDESEETYFIRYHLSTIASIIMEKIGLVGNYYLRLVPHQTTDDESTQITNHSELFFWKTLSEKAPNVHVIWLADSKGEKFYVIHIDSEDSFTMTIVSSFAQDKRISRYISRTINFIEDFPREIEDLIHDDEAPTGIVYVVDWKDPASVKSFYQTVFPEHHTIED